MGTHPIFESDFDCLTDRVRILKIKNEGKGRSSRVHHYWPKVAFRLEPTPIGVPSPTLRAGSNCRQISILVLCFLLQESQQDRRRNHLCEEGRREDPRIGEELRHLGPIRFSIWNSQHVPRIQRHDDQRRRHSVLPRHGCSPSSSTWFHPDPSSGTPSGDQRRGREAGCEATTHHPALDSKIRFPLPRRIISRKQQNAPRFATKRPSTM